MARIRHVALVVKDLEATADFYQKAFGLKRSPLSEGPTARRIYMSDGHVNLALLQYKGETGSGLKDASGFVGVHHFGFQVEDLSKQQERIEDAGGEFFFDLGDPDDDDFERKFKDPNGIIFDINWKGWALTASKVGAKTKTKGRTPGTRAANTRAASASKKRRAAAAAKKGAVKRGTGKAPAKHRATGAKAAKKRTNTKTRARTR